MGFSYLEFAAQVEKVSVLAKLAAIVYRTGWIARIANEGTYYPEKKRKGKARRILDLAVWSWKYGETHESYNVYGQDVSGADMYAYCDYMNTYMRNRKRMNSVDQPYTMTGILGDKLQFYHFCREAGIPTPEVFAFYRNNQLYDPDMRRIDLEEIREYKDYFIKDPYGFGGRFVEHIDDSEELQRKMLQLSQRDFIFQKRIEQCEEENRLYAGSINTLRIVTINPAAAGEAEEPYVLAKLQRTGSSFSGNVDNWDSGGFGIGIQDNGYLKEYGIRKYYYGGKTDTHPDTGIRFSEYKVPMLEESIALCLEAHSKLYSLHSVGWDVALTKEGPMLIEGNENWDIRLAQACDRPLRQDWLKSFKKQNNIKEE